MKSAFCQMIAEYYAVILTHWWYFTVLFFQHLDFGILRLSELKTELLSRSYNEKIIDQAFERARKIPREEALKKVIKSTDNREVLAVTYHPGLPSVANVMRKHWEVMCDQNVNLKDCFTKPSMVAYKRGKNLRDELVRARVSNKRRSSRLKNGYSPCKQACKLCWISKSTTTHSCKRLKKTWKISAPIDCNTRNVIYKLSCNKAGCQKWFYIGETKRRLCLRINDHRSTIYRKSLKHSVGRHFAKGHGHKPEAFLEVTGIERVLPHGNDLLRKRRESYWINQYNATKFGANSRY